MSSNNLLFHGCVPLNEDGTFASVNCEGTWRSGRDYLDFCDHIARRAWRDHDRDALDWMWYLWIGHRSPLSGRNVKTFERSFIEDKATWIEPMDPYFTLTHDPACCDMIMREFGVQPERGHIINGHTPVKTTSGEKPIRADGKLLVIDGGFCTAYHPKTGIAGYTLISSSRGMRLKAHEAFRTVTEAITHNADIRSETTQFAAAERRIWWQTPIRAPRSASRSKTCACCSMRTGPASSRSTSAIALERCMELGFASQRVGYNTSFGYEVPDGSIANTEDLDHGKLVAQIMKFGVVGVIAFFIDFGVMVFLTEVFGMNPVASATISFTVSVVFNYLASMRYVFQHREGMSRTREFVTFVVLSVIGLAINDALMWAGTELAAFDYRLVKIIATAVVMVWNFVTRKIFLEEHGA